MNPPTITDKDFDGITDEDVEQLVWAERVHAEFMAQLEREFASGLPYNTVGITVCLICRSPLDANGNCDFCGQRANELLLSQFFVAKY